MSLNPFIIKKWAAFLLGPFIVVMPFYFVLIYYGFMYAMGAFFVGMMLNFIICTILVKNPFSDMLEGKGILAIDLNSTGIMLPFIVNYAAPYIQAKLRNKHIKDVFDRELIQNISVPIKSESKAEMDDGKITFTLDRNQYNDSKFSMMQYPCLIYNSQNNTFLTKSLLAKYEKETYAEHILMYLNRIAEELSRITRDFARHIVDSTYQKESFFQNKWVWIIVGVIVFIIIIMMAPTVWESIQGLTTSVIKPTTAASSIINPV